MNADIIKTEPVEIVSEPDHPMQFEHKDMQPVAVAAAPMIQIERRGSGVRTSIKGMATVMQEQANKPSRSSVAGSLQSNKAKNILKLQINVDHSDEEQQREAQLESPQTPPEEHKNIVVPVRMEH